MAVRPRTIGIFSYGKMHATYPKFTRANNVGGLALAWAVRFGSVRTNGIAILRGRTWGYS